MPLSNPIVPRVRRQVGTRVGTYGGGAGTPYKTCDSTHLSFTGRFQHLAPKGGIAELQLVFDNWRHQNSGVAGAVGEIAGDNPIPVAAVGIDFDGMYLPGFFEDELRARAIPVGGSIRSEIIDVTVPEGQAYYSKFGVGPFTNTQTFPVGRLMRASLNEGHNHYGAASVLADASGAVPSGSAGEYMYGPSMILGLMRADVPSICIFGDSITQYGENGGTAGTLGDAQGFQCYLERAFGPLGWPIMTCGRTGAWGNWVATAGDRQLNEALPWITHLIWEYGRNDVTGGILPAVIQANMLTIARKAFRAGVRFFCTTITPKTTSTDGWVTTANQTASDNNANRITHNDWIRDGCPITASTYAPVATGTSGGGTIRIGDPAHPVVGYFEVADMCETSRNSGIWLAGITGDGLHPNVAQHVTMAAAIPTSKVVV